MKRSFILFFLLLLVSCGTQETNNTNIASGENLNEGSTLLDTTPRVTGIGGIFFFDENSDSLMQWYGENLGLAINPYGSPFEFRNANNPDEVNFLQWSVHGSTDYFKPSDKEFMINYRVYNIEALVKKLEGNGINMLDSITNYPDYGKFVHFMDPGGNKIELWEASDEDLDQMDTKTTK